ncbi:MAG: penicillin-binding transpeptidase domain-containing protein [Lachnotalea sp.]
MKTINKGKRRKRISRRQRQKRKIIIVIICLVALVLAGIFLFIHTQKEGNIVTNIIKATTEKKITSNPEEVLAEYMACIDSKDYQKMYDLLSEQSKLNISATDFISRNENIYEGIEAQDVKINVISTSEEDSNKIIKYDTTMDTAAGELNFTNEITLNKNDKKIYCIEWSTKVIFPNLLEDDKVKVSYTTGERGSILDRNGKVLAGKGTVASVGIVPGKLGENKEEDLAKIAEILSITVDSINDKMNASYVKSDSFVPLKSISQTDTEMKEQLLGIQGIMITDKEARVYPLGVKAAHLTGYVQNINAEELEAMNGKDYNANSVIGKIGLEKLLEDQIRGIDGTIINIVDKDGTKKLTLVAKLAQNGKNVKLTIDADLQSKLYDELENDKSSTVVMNSKTGEILALISTPSYDPNDFILGMSSDQWQALNENEAMPLYNRFKATLSPGSTFKPIIAAIGLTTNTLNHDENVGNSGLSWQKDASWGNYKVTTLKEYGSQVDMQNALINSDNIYFAKAALKIGEDTLAEQLLNLGFDESIPFQFGLGSSEFGTDNKFDSEIQLADSGYGQGKVLVNPVHMASMYSAFVNDGSMVQPYLEYKDDTTPTYWKEQVFSKEAADTICNDLIQVVESPDGTGHSAKIEGMTLAGKTGTAEIKLSKDDSEGTELGWFAAFTVDNDEKPYLAITMVEDVKDRGGSHYVIPIVKSVFED